MDNNQLGAYIHIPFCAYKCDFCDFAAFAGLNHLETEYSNVVCQEIDHRLACVSDVQLSSIFYGGGTPGLISTHLLAKMHQRIVEKIPLVKNGEVTLETTPDAITPEKAKQWLELGVNRLSIGIESLDDGELKAIGRPQSENDALKGIQIASEAGFKNISCDLMYGLPTQTNSSWRITLEKLLNLAQAGVPLTHISAYGLQLSPNSPLYSRFQKNSTAYPNENTYGEMYQILLEMLESQGFVQYEISNFSLKGFESKHNLAYWDNREYFAFGLSAHRYVNRVRSSNWRSVSHYMRDYAGYEMSEFIDDETYIREGIMLSLRLTEGIDLLQFRMRYGMDVAAKYADEIKRLEESECVKLGGGRLALTQKGVLISNTIIAEFM